MKAEIDTDVFLYEVFQLRDELSNLGGVVSTEHLTMSYTINSTWIPLISVFNMPLACALLLFVCILVCFYIPVCF